MNKLVLVAAAVMALWGLPHAVTAQAAMVINFEASPLFSEANFLPGDAVTRWVRVQNNTGVGQIMGVKIDPYQDPSNLGSQLTVVIREGATQLYSGTLDDLYAASPVQLSTVGDGASTQYDFTVTFPAVAGDAYQLAAVNFDLMLGILGAEGCTGTCNGTFIISLTGGGGSSGPQADLALSKSIIGSLPPAGSTFSYQLVVTNQGPDNATSVVVTDVLPPSLSFVSSAASQGSYSDLTGRWNVGSLSNGASASLALTVTLSSASDQTVINIASVAASEQDYNVGNNVAQYTLTLQTGEPPSGSAVTVAGAYSSGSAGDSEGGASSNLGGIAGRIAGIATALFPPASAQVPPAPGQAPGIPAQPTSSCSANLTWLMVLQAVVVALAWYRGRRSRQVWRSRFWLVSLALAAAPLVLWFGACWLVWWVMAIIILTIFSGTGTTRTKANRQFTLVSNRP